MIQGRLLRLENFCISLTFSREFAKALPSRFDVECAALTFLRDGWLSEAESSFLARTTSRWSFWIVYLKNIKKGVFQFSSWFQSAIDVTAKRKRPCSAQVFASVRTTLHRLLWTLFPYTLRVHLQLSSWFSYQAFQTHSRFSTRCIWQFYWFTVNSGTKQTAVVSTEQAGTSIAGECPTAFYPRYFNFLALIVLRFFLYSVKQPSLHCLLEVFFSVKVYTIKSIF